MLKGNIKLPNELVLKIFDFAAYSSHEFCFCLCLVSSWTRRLVLPHLLRTVILTPNTTVPLFRDYIEKNASLQAASFVRNLSLHPNFYNAGDILLACPNLTNLSATFPALVDLSRSPEWLLTSCTHLRLSFPTLPWSYTRIQTLYESLALHTTFSAITHLWLADMHSSALCTINSRNFPCLTHAAVSFGRKLDSLFMISFALIEQDCPQALEVFVLVIEDDHRPVYLAEIVEWVRVRRKTDRRMHLAYLNAREQREQWEKEVNGGESIWERAVKDTQSVEACT